MNTTQSVESLLLVNILIDNENHLIGWLQWGYRGKKHAEGYYPDEFSRTEQFIGEEPLCIKTEDFALDLRPLKEKINKALKLADLITQPTHISASGLKSWASPEKIKLANPACTITIYRTEVPDEDGAIVRWPKLLVSIHPDGWSSLAGRQPAKFL